MASPASVEPARHRRLEGRQLVGPLGEEIEDVLAIGLAHAVLAGPQTRGEVLVGARGPLVAKHHGEISDRTRHIRFEQFAGRCQGEMARRPLLEHAEAREHAHDAVERGRVRTRLGGNLLNRLRFAIHVIGDAEPRHAGQRISELLAEQKLHHHLLRRRRRLRWTIGHWRSLGRAVPRSSCPANMAGERRALRGAGGFWRDGTWVE